MKHRPVEMRRILEITSYPPPRAGWGVRVQYVKERLETDGHECVVLNIGSSRAIPSTEYETVIGARDFVRKVWRFARRGFLIHVHVNANSPKGFVLTLVAEALGLLAGTRCVMTFHGGIAQIYFPRPRHRLLWPMFWVMFAIPRIVICNNEEIKRRIVEYGVTPDKIVPIQAFSVQYLQDDDDRSIPPELATFFERFRHVTFCYMKIRPVFDPEATLEGFARLATQRSDVGLVLCGVVGHMESGLWDVVQAILAQPRLHGRVLVVDDLSHGAFLEGLRRSSLYLRTPASDGVCSSVLEALALRIPVLAVENGMRPDGVITYPPSDPARLAEALDDVLTRRDDIAESLPSPELPDTVEEEVALLTA